MKDLHFSVVSVDVLLEGDLNTSFLAFPAGLLLGILFLQLHQLVLLGCDLCI